MQHILKIKYILIVILISHAYGEVQCFKSKDIKIEYIYLKKKKEIVSDVCFNEKSFFLTSQKCLYKKKSCISNSVVDSLRWVDISKVTINPIDHLCRFVKGTPKKVRLKLNNKSHRLTLCEFKDGSFISAEYLSFKNSALLK